MNEHKRGKSQKKKPHEAELLQKEKETIDDLFGEAISKKRIKLVNKQKETEKEEEQKRKDQKASKEIEQQTSIISPNPRVHRYDEESGLPVYKYFDLKMGEPGSGFTPLCPFDCSCCF